MAVDHGAAVRLACLLAKCTSQKQELDGLVLELPAEPMEIMSLVAEFSSLFKVTKVNSKIGVGLTNWPKICFAYAFSDAGCNSTDCDRIHICLQHLLDTCESDSCVYNHYFVMMDCPASTSTNRFPDAEKNNMLLHELGVANWPGHVLKHFMLAIEFNLPFGDEEPAGRAQFRSLLQAIQILPEDSTASRSPTPVPDQGAGNGNTLASLTGEEVAATLMEAMCEAGQRSDGGRILRIGTPLPMDADISGNLMGGAVGGPVDSGDTAVSVPDSLPGDNQSNGSGSGSEPSAADPASPVSPSENVNGDGANQGSKRKVTESGLGLQGDAENVKGHGGDDKKFKRDDDDDSSPNDDAGAIPVVRADPVPTDTASSSEPQENRCGAPSTDVPRADNNASLGVEKVTSGPKHGAHNPHVPGSEAVAQLKPPIQKKRRSMFARMKKAVLAIMQKELRLMLDKTVMQINSRDDAQGQNSAQPSSTTGFDGASCQLSAIVNQVPASAVLSGRREQQSSGGNTTSTWDDRRINERKAIQEDSQNAVDTVTSQQPAEPHIATSSQPPVASEVVVKEGQVGTEAEVGPVVAAPPGALLQPTDTVKDPQVSPESQEVTPSVQTSERVVVKQERVETDSSVTPGVDITSATAAPTTELHIQEAQPSQAASSVPTPVTDVVVVKQERAPTPTPRSSVGSVLVTVKVERVENEVPKRLSRHDQQTGSSLSPAPTMDNNDMTGAVAAAVTAVPSNEVSSAVPSASGVRDATNQPMGNNGILATGSSSSVVVKQERVMPNDSSSNDAAVLVAGEVRRVIPIASDTIGNQMMTTEASGSAGISGGHGLAAAGGNGHAAEAVATNLAAPDISGRHQTAPQSANTNGGGPQPLTVPDPGVGVPANSQIPTGSVPAQLGTHLETALTQLSTAGPSIAEVALRICGHRQAVTSSNCNGILVRREQAVKPLQAVQPTRGPSSNLPSSSLDASGVTAMVAAVRAAGSAASTSSGSGNDVKWLTCVCGSHGGSKLKNFLELMLMRLFRGPDHMVSGWIRETAFERCNFAVARRALLEYTASLLSVPLSTVVGTSLGHRIMEWVIDLLLNGQEEFGRRMLGGCAAMLGTAGPVTTAPREIYIRVLLHVASMRFCTRREVHLRGARLAHMERQIDGIVWRLSEYEGMTRTPQAEGQNTAAQPGSSLQTSAQRVDQDTQSRRRKTGRNGSQAGANVPSVRGSVGSNNDQTTSSAPPASTGPAQATYQIALASSDNVNTPAGASGDSGSTGAAPPSADGLAGNSLASGGKLKLVFIKVPDTRTDHSQASQPTGNSSSGQAPSDSGGTQPDSSAATSRFVVLPPPDSDAGIRKLVKLPREERFKALEAMRRSGASFPTMSLRSSTLTLDPQPWSGATSQGASGSNAGQGPSGDGACASQEPLSLVVYSPRCRRTKRTGRKKSAARQQGSANTAGQNAPQTSGASQGTSGQPRGSAPSTTNHQSGPYAARPPVGLPCSGVIKPRKEHGKRLFNETYQHQHSISKRSRWDRPVRSHMPDPLIPYPPPAHQPPTTSTAAGPSQLGSNLGGGAAPVPPPLPPVYSASKRAFLPPVGLTPAQAVTSTFDAWLSSIPRQNRPRFSVGGRAPGSGALGGVTGSTSHASTLSARLRRYRADFSAHAIDFAFTSFNWNVVDVGGHLREAFQAWAPALQRGLFDPDAGVIRLSEVDVTEMISFAERYPGSRIPMLLEATPTSSFDPKSNTLYIGDERFDIKKGRSVRSIMDLPDDDSKNVTNAWFFKNPETNDWQLLTGTYNGMTFGLGPSRKLEAARAIGPNWGNLVIFRSFGLARNVVNLDEMKMRTETGEEFDLKRDEVQISPKVKPHWIPMLASGSPRSILKPVLMDMPFVKMDLDGKIPQTLIMKISHEDIQYRVNVVQVYMIQNPHRLKNFEDRAGEMAHIYQPYAREVNLERKIMFHGTDPGAIAAICHDGFDWRRAGDSTGARYGQGTYFSTSFQVSSKYAREVTSTPASPVQEGRRRFVFVADVLVGLTEKGHSLLRYPSIWKDDVKYDTAVEELQNPEIFVKFESSESYPKYLMEYELTCVTVNREAGNL